MPVIRTSSWTIDYVEAGSGPCVILLHSSAAGNRQWRRTIERFQDQYHVIAVNFFGYGQTSPGPVIGSRALPIKASWFSRSLIRLIAMSPWSGIRSVA